MGGNAQCGSTTPEVADGKLEDALADQGTTPAVAPPADWKLGLALELEGTTPAATPPADWKLVLAGVPAPVFGGKGGFATTRPVPTLGEGAWGDTRGRASGPRVTALPVYVGGKRVAQSEHPTSE
ncbi:unnamed protein product [Ectocarpus sp. CCAP 1310/34]|nr:unnamed protein product [Ectocarpus sp. CCAP 1310/34]CAB1103345.1 unnamed protein product [Ectocarpus sp. CCAP 1310/34]CAB1114512.1 unnamed protein product [Ectocarpus sp. CCAP 1310/34]